MGQVIYFLFLAAYFSMQWTVKWTLFFLPEIGLLRQKKQTWAFQFHKAYNARFSILRTLELKPDKLTEAFYDSQFTFLIMHCK